MDDNLISHLVFRCYPNKSRNSNTHKFRFHVARAIYFLLGFEHYKHPYQPWQWVDFINKAITDLEKARDIALNDITES